MTRAVCRMILPAIASMVFFSSAYAQTPPTPEPNPQPPVPATAPATAYTNDERDQIEDRIEKRWEADAALKSIDIDVEVDNTGIATLTGNVPTAALKARAGRLAKVTGVVRVQNQIEVARDTNVGDKVRTGTETAVNKTGEAVGTAAEKTGEAVGTAAKKTGEGLKETGEVVSDTWITTKVKTHFSGSDTLEGSNITVNTKDGIVTLSGSVRSDVQRAKATEIAKGTRGVKNVVDKLTVPGS